MLEISILVKGFPIEEVEVDTAIKVGWQAEEGTKEHSTKEREWAMIDEMLGTKVGRLHSDLDYNEDIVHPPCPIDMVEALWPPLVDEEEILQYIIFPLVYNI